MAVPATEVTVIPALPEFPGGLFTVMRSSGNGNEAAKPSAEASDEIRKLNWWRESGKNQLESRREVALRIARNRRRIQKRTPLGAPEATRAQGVQ